MYAVFWVSALTLHALFSEAPVSLGLYVFYPLTIVVPGVVFVLGTAVRRAFHAARPYQLADYEPLVHRGKTDDSFPSRHVFSASVIAAAFWYVCPPLGLLLTVSALLLAPVRVLAGVHFPRDVLAGLVFGFGAGWLGCFVLLPNLP